MNKSTENLGDYGLDWTHEANPSRKAGLTLSEKIPEEYMHKSLTRKEKYSHFRGKWGLSLVLVDVVEQLRFAENINWSSQKDFIRGELVRGEASGELVWQEHTAYLNDGLGSSYDTHTQAH